jgi:hypothetical protein
MYAIGVGNVTSGQLNITQLMEIASSPKQNHIFLVSDFNSLIMILQEISFKVDDLLLLSFVSFLLLILSSQSCVFVTGVLPATLPAGQPATLTVEGLGFRSTSTLTVRFTPTTFQNITTNQTTTKEAEEFFRELEWEFWELEFEEGSGTGNGTGSGSGGKKNNTGPTDVKGQLVNSTAISCQAPPGSKSSLLSTFSCSRSPRPPRPYSSSSSSSSSYSFFFVLFFMLVLRA